jgi:hypothetical protein
MSEQLFDSEKRLIPMELISKPASYLFTCLIFFSNLEVRKFTEELRHNMCASCLSSTSDEHLGPPHTDYVKTSIKT